MDIVINTVKIKNICSQKVGVVVKTTDPNSPFITKSGIVDIMPTASIEVEESRIDLQQLKQMALNNTISYERLTRAISRGSSSGA